MTASTLPSAPTPFAEPEPHRAGPDFICMGMMKAGTQWLYDQLQHHPDFWMTPYKELHYFDRVFPGGRIQSNALKLLTEPEKTAAKREERNDRPVDERDTAFFQQVSQFSAPPRDFDAYERLFEPAGDLLTGDITPGYSTLRKGLIRKIATRFEGAKAIMMLREPSSRLWSHWNMRHVTRGDTEEQGLDLETFRKFAGKKEVVKRSYPTRIARKWRQHFGDRFGCFFLDDVIARPDETRAAVLEFLGASQTGPAVLPPDFNRKEKPKSLRRTPEIQAFLKEKFAAERVACAEMFGGAALKWPDAPY